jgi:hypothetical protein
MGNADRSRHAIDELIHSGFLRTAVPVDTGDDAIIGDAVDFQRLWYQTRVSCVTCLEMSEMGN